MRAPSPRASARLLLLTTVATTAAVVAVPALASSDPATPRLNDPPPGFEVVRVPSETMAPTIAVGQNVLVRIYADRTRARPAVGTIVITNPPRSAAFDGSRPDDAPCADRRNIREGRPCARGRGGRWKTERYIKRIVAGPGDAVAFRDGRVIRNGQPVDEPFIAATCAGAEGAATACNLRRTITLPRNRYFLAGDNRGESNDSRYWGPVPRAWLVGEVTQIGVPSPTLFR